MSLCWSLVAATISISVHGMCLVCSEGKPGVNEALGYKSYATDQCRILCLTCDSEAFRQRVY